MKIKSTIFRGGVIYTESKRDLVVDVTQADVDTAIPNAKDYCVFAEACKRDNKVGSRLIAVEVGAKILKLIYHSSRAIKIVRYIVDPDARQALLHFDHTSEWTLPLGRTVVARRMDKNNSLLSERKRIRAARKNGKCRETGVRAAKGLPRRVTGRRIPARHVNFLQRADQLDLGVRQILTGASIVGAK